MCKVTNLNFICQKFCHIFLCVLSPLPKFAFFEVFEVFFVLVAFPFKRYALVRLPVFHAFHAVSDVVEGVENVEENHERLRLLPYVDSFMVDELFVPVRAHFRFIVTEYDEGPERYARVMLQHL